MPQDEDRDTHDDSPFRVAALHRSTVILRRNEGHTARPIGKAENRDDVAK